MEPITQTMKTPEEILAQREKDRTMCILAHTPNGSGEFYARFGCPCYNCRDELDPTGEEDAKSYNDALLKRLCEDAKIPPPPPCQRLKRQNAVCLCCETSHDAQQLCKDERFKTCSLGPSTGAFNECFPFLVPPPPAIRQPPSTASSIMSPLVGVMTPRSSSDASTLEEKTASQETQLVLRLKRILKTYEQVQAHIDELNSQEGLKHDEMAAYDAWWNEVDTKIAAVQELLKLLQE